MFNILNVKSNSESIDASKIIKLKLLENGGVASVRSLNGKHYDIRITRDECSFECKELPVNPPYELLIFNIIVALLIRQGGAASKGNGRNYRLGEKQCDRTTVVGTIGYEYAGKQDGEAVYDPVFVLAAILDWANICNNKRGYLELTSEYRQMVNNI